MWTDFKWFGGAFLDAFGAAGLDLESGNVKALLTTAAYTPNQDTHTHLDDVTDELVDASYARPTLTSPAVTYDAGTNKVKFTSDPFAFADLDDTFRHLLLFLDTGTPATSTLIGFSSSDVDVTSAGTPVTVTPNANGLFDVTLS